MVRLKLNCVLAFTCVFTLASAMVRAEVAATPATSAVTYRKLDLQPIDGAVRGAFGPAIGAAFEKEIEDDFGEVTKIPLKTEQIDLGRMLFYETRLSKNQQISCNTCHQLDKYGVDGESTSPGHKKQRGGRNSPTVYNAAGHFSQFWDGRAKDVEEQAKGPILNPIEMAMASGEQVIQVLESMPGYVEAFKKAFPDDKTSITYDNIAAAIGAFERKLITPSPFDKFIAGDDGAMNAEEKKGFQVFVAAGCVTCHSGPVLGGRMYQKAGLVKPWPDIKDMGRFDLTKGEGDRHVFKVPSLRNIAKTAPYMHDGSVHDLNRQVQMMARHQLAVELSPADVKSIVTFLHTLTGEIPTDYIKPPKLPESGPNTPKSVLD